MKHLSSSDKWVLAPYFLVDFTHLMWSIEGFILEADAEEQKCQIEFGFVKGFAFAMMIVGLCSGFRGLYLLTTQILGQRLLTWLADQEQTKSQVLIKF